MRRAIFAACRVFGVTAAAAFLVAWQLSPVPLVLKVVPAALVVLTLVRPSAGLLVTAGLGPVIGALAVRLASPYGATHAFEQLVLAVLLGAGLRVWRRPVPLQLAEPALLMASVAIGSAIAVQPVLLMHQVPGASAVEHLRILLSGAYFDHGMSGEPITFAAMTAEGLALAVVAERLVRDDAALAPQIVRMLVLGHAGLALASIDRVIGAALRTDTVLASIVRLLRTVRVSTYADLNAAGSALAMVFAAGLGLLLDSSRWRWPTSFALVARRCRPVVGGIAYCASGARRRAARTADRRSDLAARAHAMDRRGRDRRRHRNWSLGRRLLSGDSKHVSVIGARGARVPDEDRSRHVAICADPRRGDRAVLDRVGQIRWRAASVQHRQRKRAQQFSSSARRAGHRRRFGARAHARHALRRRAPRVYPAVPVQALPRHGDRRLRLDVDRRSSAAASEAGFAFWLLAGVLAGVTTPPALSGWRTVVALCAVTMLVIGPVRADRAIRDEGFEYVGAGVSGWRPELDGVRYREAGARFQLYLPSDGTAVTLPLRRAPNAADPLVVVPRVGRQRLDEVRLTGNAWLEVPIHLPTANRKFELVEFTVTGADASSTSTLVFVGKTVVRSR